MPDPIFLTREQAIERLGVPESTFEWMGLKGTVYLFRIKTT